MTLDELAATLPNGFHDAHVAGVHIDYTSRVMTLDVDLWIGSDSEPEARRPVRLVLNGLQFCVIEPPDTNYDYASAKALWTSDVVEPPSHVKLPTPRDPNAFIGSFFVNQWNAFIHLAATDASLA